MDDLYISFYEKIILANKYGSYEERMSLANEIRRSSVLGDISKNDEDDLLSELRINSDNDSIFEFEDRKEIEDVGASAFFDEISFDDLEEKVETKKEFDDIIIEDRGSLSFFDIDDLEDGGE